MGGDVQLIFDGYGVPDSGGLITVQVGDATRTVAINPDTGSAEVQ